MPHSGIGMHQILKYGKPNDILGTYFTKWGYHMKMMEGDNGAALKI